MFADYFFILVFIIGFLGAAFVIAFLFVGLMKRSSGLKKIGFVLSIVPVICLGAFYWYYHVHLPKVKDQNILYYSGTYSLQSSVGQSEINAKARGGLYLLRLKTDMTYYLDNIPGMDFRGNGIWEHNESLLSFSDFSGKVLGTAYGQGGHPSQLIFNHLEENEIRFIRIQD